MRPPDLGEALRIDLDFWGRTVALFVCDEDDESYFRFYFRSYLIDMRGDPDRQVALTTHPRSSFIRSLGDEDVKKSVWVDRDSRWELYESFELRARRKTVLPPLFDAELFPGHEVRHSAAVALPAGRGGMGVLTISGPSLAGKTTLSLAILLLESSALFLTDDILLQAGTLAYPYTRPISIRGPTLRILPGLQQLVGDGIEVSSKSTRILLCHPADMFPVVTDRMSVLAHSVLTASVGSGRTRCSLGHPVLRLSPEESEDVGRKAKISTAWFRGVT